MKEETPGEPSDRRPARTIGDVRASVDGPTLVLVGGLHANEPAGIEAAQRVHSLLARGSPGLRSGRLVSLRGNLAALAEPPQRRRRYIDQDLNRVFLDADGASGSDASSVERRERDELAQELESIVNGATGTVHLVDMHTVSSDSPPFVVLEDSLAARRFASVFPLPMILGLEEELRGLLIDFSTQRHGCISCIVEAGEHDDPRSIDIHESLVLLAMQALGLIAPGSLTSSGELPIAVASQAAGSRGSHVYDLRQRYGIGHRSFEARPDAVAFSRVRARRTVVATERGDPVTAEADGLLFMPNRQDARHVGDDGFFIVQRVGRGWLGLSTVLRQSETVHRLLPAVLPGVRQRPGERGTLLVAPEYAAILRREILHLLGYRLVRWHHTPYLSRRRRLLLGVGSLARSLAGIVALAGRGGERAALPAEQETDWIARRRRLDLHPPGNRPAHPPPVGGSTKH